MAKKIGVFLCLTVQMAMQNMYLGMFWKFKDAKDAKNANYDESSATFGHFTVALGLKLLLVSNCTPRSYVVFGLNLSSVSVALGLLDDKHDEVWNDCQDVEDVHDVETELTFGRTSDKSHDEFDTKPCHADCLHDVERILCEINTHFLKFWYFFKTHYCFCAL